jgi:dTDP-4-dehydrorhamnose reductase
MKVLLTGATGQLGQGLVAQCPQRIGGQPLELIACSRDGGRGMQALDLADAEACRHLLQAHRPQWVINAGAYTAVDRAESEPELAWAVNAGAPRALARALAEWGGRLLQISTDFVFDGAQGHPYEPDQPRCPLGVYGASKAAGEVAVQEQLGPAGLGTILRTSWLYGPVGHNFCRTMLRLHRERDQIAVVADQVGCPTSTQSLAGACWRLLASDHLSLPPILHWSDAGAATWYDFAVAIGELALAAGLLPRPALVRPIRTVDYPTPAHRPSYSLLACADSRALLGLEPLHWRTALAEVLACVLD